MTSSLIRYERHGCGAWIIFDDPENLNAISPALIAQVGDALAHADADAEVRAIVLSGSGRAFCGGANLKVIKELLSDDVERVVEEFLMPLKTLLRRLRESPKPVVAAVNGICMAGGMETILCCDFIIAAEGAVMGDQHATYGLLPAVGGAQGLIRSVGMMRAKEMLLTGGRYTAEQLHAWGLINKVVPHAELRQATQEAVEHLGQRSRRGLARMKQMVNDEAEMPWEAATRYELSLVFSHLFLGDPQEGLAAFSEKRKPSFRP